MTDPPAGNIHRVRADAPASPSELIQPASPLLERSLVYIGAAALALAGGVLWFGEIDAVVSAPARVLPERDLVPVQSRNAGLLADVPVSIGQTVDDGQLIARLVGETSAADLAALERRVAVQSDDRDRTVRIVSALEELERTDWDTSVLSGPLLDFAPAVERFHGLRRAILERDRMARAAGPDYLTWRAATTARLGALEGTISMRTNTLAAAEAERVTLAETAILRAEQLELARDLRARGVATETRVLDARDRLLAAEGELNRQDEKIADLRFAMAEDRLQITELQKLIADEAEARNDRLALAEQDHMAARMALQTLLVETRAQLRDRELDLLRDADLLTLNRESARAMEVRAPVAGEIVALTHTAPGIRIAQGEELAALVPLGVPNILQASLPSREAGRVRPGQRAIVKLDPFPFYRFGTQDARVLAVFPNPQTNDFTVRLALLSQHVDVAGIPTAIPVGSDASVEIVTERRRLFDILLDRGADALLGETRPQQAARSASAP